MGSTREFPIADVLTVVTGKMLVEDFGRVYEILNYMTGDDLYTHQLPDASTVCALELLHQYAALASVNYLARYITPENWSDKFADMKAMLGWETLAVAPLPEGVWRKHDPLADLVRMILPEKIIIARMRKADANGLA